MQEDVHAILVVRVGGAHEVPGVSLGSFDFQRTCSQLLKDAAAAVLGQHAGGFHMGHLLQLFVGQIQVTAQVVVITSGVSNDEKTGDLAIYHIF